MHGESLFQCKGRVGVVGDKVTLALECKVPLEWIVLYLTTERQHYDVRSEL